MKKKFFKKGWGMIFLLSIVLSSCNPVKENTIFTPKAEHVFLIGIDGWGAYSMNKAKVPNIRQLMRSGSYTLKKGQFFLLQALLIGHLCIWGLGRNCTDIVNGVLKFRICLQEF